MKRIVVWDPVCCDDPEDFVFSVYCTVVSMFHHAPDDKQTQYWHTFEEFAADHGEDPKLVERIRPLVPDQFKRGGP